jgi:hypothetical protein
LLEVTVDIFEGSLQTIKVPLEFLEVLARYDQFIRPQPMSRRQFPGHVSLLSATLLAVNPAPAGALLFW